jgi:hypothetical protein
MKILPWHVAYLPAVQLSALVVMHIGGAHSGRMFNPDSFVRASHHFGSLDFAATHRTGPLVPDVRNHDLPSRDSRIDVPTFTPQFWSSQYVPCLSATRFSRDETSRLSYPTATSSMLPPEQPNVLVVVRSLADSTPLPVLLLS